ncbi:hypothetical protein FOA52_005506 [Chlamydomonas sp. UWO 241]|nr:hypothetical protein FOA52_005506 [Chlamydomonas sp. UWO 241]
MADESKILADALKLPLRERCEHASWKARQAAYDDVRARCEKGGVDDTRLAEFASIFPKAVGDANAAAQGSALDALVAFLAVADSDVVARSVDKVCSGLVSKALGARTTNVASARDAMMLIVELEHGGKVLDALIGVGLTSKVPKIVIAALEALAHVYAAFGTKVLDPKPLFKALPALFETKDGKAREKVKDLLVELSRWVGADVIRATLYPQMRDAMKDDIDKAVAALQELGIPRPVPSRTTRSEQARAAAAAAAGAPDVDNGGDAMEVDDDGGGGGGGGDGDGAAAEVDAYDFASSKDILPLLGKPFWEGLAAAKWSERKDALSTLKGLASAPRLATGRDYDYGDLNRELRKTITKDANVLCVTEAIGCCAAMAGSMRGAFSSTAKGLAEVLLEKFKEKSAAVVRAAAGALSVMRKHCWSLPDIIENLTGALSHVSPKVKEDTLKWLAEELPLEPKASLPKLAGPLLPLAAKCAAEAAPGLREAAVAFLVAFSLQSGSSTAVDKHTSGLDDARKKAIARGLAEAQGASAAGGGGGGAAGEGAGSGAGTSSSASRARPASAAPSTMSASQLVAQAKSAKASAAGAAKKGVVVKKAVGGAATGGGGGGAKGGGVGGGDPLFVEDDNALSGGVLPKDALLGRMGELLGEETLKELGSEDWKARLAAMATVVERAGGASGGDIATLAQGMGVVPGAGWTDKNFQVMAKQFDVIAACAQSDDFGRTEAFVGVTAAVEKLADLKLKGPGCTMLTAAAEAVGPSFIATTVHRKASVHKNPKVLSEALGFIGQLIESFGLAALPVKALVGWAKDALSSPNFGVKNAAITLLGAMHRFLGLPLGDMIRTDVKPALMAAVDAEFAKNPKRDASTELWAPTRAWRKAVAASTSSAVGARTSDGGAEAGSSGAARGGSGGGAGAKSSRASPLPDLSQSISVDDLLPRQDVSGELSSAALLTNLGSSNWKDRKQGLDDVEQILTSAGSRISPSLGDLVPALKARLGDSNKNLVMQALGLVSKLARAIGRPADRSLRPLLSAALKNASDGKPLVRSAVTDMCDAWAGMSGADCLVAEWVEQVSSAKCTPEGRAEGVGWLAHAAVGRGGYGRVGDSCSSDLMRALALGASDKAAEVRGSAARLADALACSFAPGALAKALESLKADERKTATEALARAGGGATASAASAAGTGSASASVAPSVARTSSLRSSTVGAVAANGGGVRSSSASLRPRSAGVGASSSAAAGAAAFTAAAAGDDGPPILLDKKKDERAKKGRYRPSKFEVRADEPATLESEFTPLLGSGLRTLMFDPKKDFRKYCNALDVLGAGLASGDMVAEIMGVLDLLFRWCVLRLVEANTQSLVRTLDFIKALLDYMEGAGERLSEYEVKLLLPTLVEKSGHNQDKIKTEHKDLLRRASVIYPPSRVALFLRDGLDSKNNKSRVVSLEALGDAIKAHGAEVYRGNSQADIVGSVARLVTERDGAVRQGVLMCIEAVYRIEGEDMWTLAGRLTEQQQSLMQERLKYTDRELAKAGLSPGIRVSAAGTLSGDMDWEGAAPSPRPATPLGRSSANGAANGARAVGGRPASPSPGARGTRPPSPLRGGMTRTGSRPLSPGPAARRPAFAAGASAASASSRASASSAAGSILAGGGGGIGGGARPGSAGVRASTSALPRSAAAAATYSRDADASASASGRPGTAAFAGSASGTAHGLRMSLDMAGAREVGMMSVRQSTSGGCDSIGSFARLRRESDEEMCEDFEACLAALCNSGMDDSTIQVMKLLCYEFQDLDPAVLALLKESVDELVLVLCDRMDEIFSVAGACVAAGAPHNNRACKYVLNLMANVFNVPSLACSVGQAPLRSALSTVLCCLVDDRIVGAPEGVALLRALNLLVMKALENSDRTFVFGALIPLLLRPPERLGQLSPYSKYEALWYELLVKCTIKATKALQADIESVDLRSLLLHIHQFFEELGPEELRRRGAREDKPVRMVKTVLHEICKAKGLSVYSYASGIPGADLDPSQRPHIFPYMDLNLSTMGLGPGPQAAGPLAPAPGAPPAPPPAPRDMYAGSGPSPAAAARMPVLSRLPSTSDAGSRIPRGSPGPYPADTPPPPGLPPPSSSLPVPSPPPQLAPSADVFALPADDDAAARATLAAIFKRIAEKDTQALVDLYFFREANPEVELDAMLSSASTTFKNFIMRGLYKVKNQAGQPLQRADTGSNGISQAAAAAGSPMHTSPDSQRTTRFGGRSVEGPATTAAASAATAPPPIPAAAATAYSAAAASAASAAAPGSPARTSRVGGDNIAALRERMNQMQLAYQSTQRPVGSGIPSGTASPRPAARALDS